jgi:hypothetical protein
VIEFSVQLFIQSNWPYMWLWTRQAWHSHIFSTIS